LRNLDLKKVSEFQKWIPAVACPRAGGGGNDGKSIKNWADK
jgi:hypothetical protein